MEKSGIIKEFVLIIFLLLFASVLNAAGDDYLAFAQKMPEPANGMAEIYKNITYPRVAQKAGVQGKVFVLCFIDEEGNVNDVKVIRGIGAGCDEAAVEAIKNVKFNPGENEGKPVKVKLSLAIIFKLQ